MSKSKAEIQAARADFECAGCHQAFMIFGPDDEPFGSLCVACQEEAARLRRARLRAERAERAEVRREVARFR